MAPLKIVLFNAMASAAMALKGEKGDRGEPGTLALLGAPGEVAEWRSLLRYGEKVLYDPAQTTSYYIS